jgi:hypothetical protein
MLDLPEGVTQAREPWVTEAYEVDRESELDDYERAAVKRCAAAESPSARHTTASLRP